MLREDLPIVCNCPICSGYARLQDVTPNYFPISATQELEESCVEIYDTHIAPYKCINGHMFYISYKTK